MSKLQSRSAQAIRYFTDPHYWRMADDLHLAGMSQRTHDGYLRAVRQLADFCKTSPDKITEAQLRRKHKGVRTLFHVLAHRMVPSGMCTSAPSGCLQA